MSAIFRHIPQPVSPSHGEAVSGSGLNALVALPALAAFMSVGAPAILTMLGVMACVGTWEHTRLTGRALHRVEGASTHRALTVLGGMAFFAAVALLPGGIEVALGMSAMLFLGAVLARATGQRKTVVLGSWLHVALPLGFLARWALEAGPAGGAWLVLSLVVLGLADASASVAARRLVRPAAVMLGAIAAVVTAAAVHATGLVQMERASLLVMAGVAYGLGVVGAWTLRGLERAAGVTRSGTLWGSGGGVLDHLDALLFSAPWLYLAWTMWG